MAVNRTPRSPKLSVAALSSQGWGKQFPWIPPEAPSPDCLGEQECSKGHFRFIIKEASGASRQVKAPAVKTEELSSVLRTRMMEGKN